MAGQFDAEKCNRFGARDTRHTLTHTHTNDNAIDRSGVAAPADMFRQPSRAAVFIE